MTFALHNNSKRDISKAFEEKQSCRNQLIQRLSQSIDSQVRSRLVQNGTQKIIQVENHTETEDNVYN